MWNLAMAPFEIGGNPLLWFGLAIVFAIVEALTLGIVSIWFLIGSLVAMVVSFISSSIWIETIVFLIVSLALVFTSRQWALKHLKVGCEKTNTERLIGKEAVITQATKPYDYGELKVEGVHWRCQSESNRIYEVGEVVTIQAIRGVTLILE